MEILIRISGLCLTASAAASLLRKENGSFSLLLSIAAAVTGAVMLFKELTGLLSLWDELEAMTGLAPSIFEPMLKVTAISCVSRVGSALCADAGQSALSRVMETAGALCAMGCTVPLVHALMELVRGWI